MNRLIKHYGALTMRPEGMSKAKKYVYETPELVSFGKVRDITREEGSGISDEDHTGSRNG